MERLSLLAIGKQPPTLPKRKDLGYSLAVARSLAEAREKLRAEPDIVLFDVEMRSSEGLTLVAEMKRYSNKLPAVIFFDSSKKGESQMPGLVSVAKLLNQDRGSEAEKARAAPSILRHLYNEKTGRADAIRIAKELGLSVAELARILARTPQAVHKTPDSKGLQNKLSIFTRILTSLRILYGREENGRLWLNAPHRELDQERPIELIKKRKGEVVADLLEDALTGHPS